MMRSSTRVADLSSFDVSRVRTRTVPRANRCVARRSSPAPSRAAKQPLALSLWLRDWRATCSLGGSFATPAARFFVSGNHDALDRVLHLPLAQRETRGSTATVALQTHALASGCVAWRHLRRRVARVAHVPRVRGGTAIAWCPRTRRQRAHWTVSRVTLAVRRAVVGKVCKSGSFPFAPRPSLRRESRRPLPGAASFFCISRRVPASSRPRRAPWRPWRP